MKLTCKIITLISISFLTAPLLYAQMPIDNQLVTNAEAPHQEIALIADSISAPVISLNTTHVKPICSPYDKPYSFTQNYPNFRRLGTTTGVMFGSAIVGVGLLYIMPESFTNWDRDELKFKNLGKKWKDNVTAGPVVDNDDVFLNWVMHPYFGAVYYMGARSAGFNAPLSFFYSAFLSTCFWEYGLESFAEIPSLQDLLITPGLGAVLGEFFYLAKREILNNNYFLLGSRFLGYSALFLMDPLNTVIDWVGGTTCSHQHNKGVSMQLAPLSVPSLAGGSKPSMGLSLSIYF